MKHYYSIINFVQIVTCIREKCPSSLTIYNYWPLYMYTDLLLFLQSLLLFHITNACKEELKSSSEPFSIKSWNYKVKSCKLDYPTWDVHCTTWEVTLLLWFEIWETQGCCQNDVCIMSYLWISYNTEQILTKVGLIHFLYKINFIE